MKKTALLSVMTETELELPQLLPAYHKNPQINHKTLLHFTYFTSLFFTNILARSALFSRSSGCAASSSKLVSASSSGCFSGTSHSGGYYREHGKFTGQRPRKRYACCCESNFSYFFDSGCWSKPLSWHLSFAFITLCPNCFTFMWIP